MTVSLEKAPPFSALSYAWGDSKQNKEIELDGTMILISSNLLDALVQFQAEMDPSSSCGLLWIDAICINQSDTFEKSKQVQMMGDIYHNASTVIVWLGKEDAQCRFAIESINAIYDAQVFTQSGIRSAIGAIDGSKDGASGQDEILERVKSDLELLLQNFDFVAVVNAVERLISRQWWRRLWVIQELVLSKLAYIKCGPTAVPWDMFEYFLDVCELFMLCHPTHKAYYPVYLVGHKAFVLSKFWRQVHSGKTMTMFELFESMITMAVRETSDDRDRIYALLSLAADAAQLGIQPNYSLSRVQVYSITMETLIVNQGLIMLSYCSSKQNDKIRTDGLPSWAPDMAGTVPDPLRGNSTSSIYRACGSTEAEFSFQAKASLRLLKIQSVIVDRVLDKTRERPLPTASFDVSKAKTLRKWLRGYGKLMERSKASSRPLIDSKQAIWRTPIANIVSKRGQETYREARSEDETGFATLIGTNGMSIASGSDEVFIDYCYSAWLRTVGRSLFVSYEGYLGLGSCELKTGDFICIFLGADIPFIVRDVGGDHCRLVGEAYVHGIMEGQFMRRDPRIGPLYLV